MDDLISKRELLVKYGISYGALYRWKRMGLIPEDWFLKKSAVTGQETFFRRDVITERIETILRLKDTLSLEAIAEQLNGTEKKKEVLRVRWHYGRADIPLDELEGITLISGDSTSTDLTEALHDIISKMKGE